MNSKNSKTNLKDENDDKDGKEDKEDPSIYNQSNTQIRLIPETKLFGISIDSLLVENKNKPLTKMADLLNKSEEGSKVNQSIETHKKEHFEKEENSDKKIFEIASEITQNIPKFFMKVLDNIKKEKGLNIFNSFEYIINALINMHFERKLQSNKILDSSITNKIENFRKANNLDTEPADEEVFVSFMETFQDFNFFE